MQIYATIGLSGVLILASGGSDMAKAIKEKVAIIIIMITQRQRPEIII